MSSSLAILQAQFPGQIRIQLTSSAKVLDLAEQSIRNQISKGTFPIPTVLDGGRRFVFIQDLAEFLETQRLTASAGKKKRRGPRTNAEKFAAERLASGGEQ